MIVKCIELFFLNEKENRNLFKGYIYIYIYIYIYKTLVD